MLLRQRNVERKVLFSEDPDEVSVEAWRISSGPFRFLARQLLFLRRANKSLTSRRRW